MVENPSGNCPSVTSYIGKELFRKLTFSEIFSRQYAMAYDSDNGRCIAFLVITTGFKPVIMTGVHLPPGSNP
jgi:hypothetical protein